MTYTSIDLFAGCGGITEGLSQAGFRCELAIERDIMAGKTFNYNHPNVPTIINDITAISSDTIKQYITEDITVITGGPPCQGFSYAGSRNINDPRNFLFKEFVRIVNDIRPKTFIFENVAGIMSINNGKALTEILECFTDIGYTLSYKLINCADYGVPQARKRFIIIGNRDSYQIGFPTTTHGPTAAFPHITCAEAFAGLPMPSFTETLSIKNHISVKHSIKNEHRYSLIPQGKSSIGHVPMEFRIAKQSEYKLNSAKPANTVTGSFRTELIHYSENRTITAREAARLQSFPDSYVFSGVKGRHSGKYLGQDQQIGNAVPPLLAKILGEHIIHVLSTH